ncbi:MAG: hypothetical protein J7500_18500 [Sphingomonas sp.]|uniref:hypothetical protein n=1 Tax=Sphingomonas sp. TaxID=28214 RepID=UPI001B039A11|nr:hypothetical protein [Sphingomonas sp.]MBO9624702.1 hypothetical protein [Sphingomonas sp.]
MQRHPHPRAHHPRALAALSAGLLLLLPVVAAAGPTRTEELSLGDKLGQWIPLAEDPAQPITLDLIRADVRIEPSADGTSRMMVRAKRPDQAMRITLRLHQDSQAIAVTDLYPMRSHLFTSAECLPPPDVRGDFWLVDAGLEVVLRVPPRTRVTVRLRDGAVRDPRTQ